MALLRSNPARVWAQAKEKQASKVNEWGRVLQMGEFARQVNAAQHHEAYAYERRRQQVCCTLAELPEMGHTT